MPNRYYKEVNGEMVFFTGNVLYTDEASILNPSHEQMLAAGWRVYVEPEPTAEEMLKQAKAEKLAEIAAYDSSENVNVFFLGGYPMWLDPSTRQTLRISIESYQAMGISEVIKWFGGRQYTFPAQTWLAMLNALEVYAGDALNATERHRVTVSSLESIDEVEQYDITTGYPEPLNLTPQWLQQHTQSDVQSPG